MKQKIEPINMPLPFKLGSVNCYLFKADPGFVLIDTGSANKREELFKEMQGAGCQLGDLNLIVITHGDFDHIGNAAYFRDKFASKIAMHADDLAMAEHGDMLANRKQTSLLNRLVAFLTSRLMRFGESEKFSPDIFLKEGDLLSEYGVDAQVISIPGHSSGSIGIMTTDGDFFCGDLFENTTRPGLNSIMDDKDAAQASFEKLKGYPIQTVYPGHGPSFPMRLILEE